MHRAESTVKDEQGLGLPLPTRPRRSWLPGARRTQGTEPKGRDHERDTAHHHQQPDRRARAAVHPAGQPVTRFRVASTPRFRDNQTGEWKDGDSVPATGISDTGQQHTFAIRLVRQRLGLSGSIYGYRRWQMNPKAKNRKTHYRRIGRRTVVIWAIHGLSSYLDLQHQSVIIRVHTANHIRLEAHRDS